ncbi:MAG: cell division protein SepF [Candidatus Nanopelagicales bacterium]
MAGAMRKMAVYLGLVEDDSDLHDDYDDDYVETRRDSRSSGYESREVRPVSPVPETRSVRTFRDEAPAATPERRSAPAPDRRPAPATAAAGTSVLGEHYRIHTIHPHSYNDARRIGEEFREGIPVIMNLTEMEDGDAKRIVDFAAGLVFGLHGSIERVTNKVFLLSPANVDVAAEARAQLAQDGFFNQS